jgi:peroxiredoxin
MLFTAAEKFLIDRNGQVVERFTSVAVANSMEPVIAKLLEQPIPQGSAAETLVAQED